jgi:hypothetical protein
VLIDLMMGLSGWSWIYCTRKLIPAYWYCRQNQRSVRHDNCIVQRCILDQIRCLHFWSSASGHLE